ncbi:penicillin-binding transpeptidase domain-containing protein [Romboutsia sp.]|uniref:penicillin-binding transpeptidase domain-containing protein n=1 Tax=Romboutsia sp. TaxID=1965302 RepID=UPI002BAEC365|nr:penicillin-binding transpeptidase domain-containing protein [Romboutsia sp.]HSQ89232.1 penicillin-binding transpeptidase domain-containing protein [Romboutsia sp.]
MEENKKVDRLSIMKKIILAAFIVILSKVIYMTTFKHEHYTQLAENKTYKELPIKAPRGEIKDRYGRLIAGNKNLFTVQVSGDEINKKNSNGESIANEICLKLINLLEDNKEEYIDEFPIYLENGKYYYTFDKNIREYKSKSENNIPQDLNAKESFYFIVDKAIIDGKLTQEDRKLEPSKLQKKLNENAIYPPILVSKWMFTEEKNKKDWLESYKIKNSNISAKNAFKEIRNSKNYQINKKLSDKDARKILIVRDLIKSQGYSGYKPVTIAKDINQKTIAQIEESAIELPGISVAVEPVRDYPEANLASHIVGYVGKMSSSDENYYLTDDLNKEEDKEYYEGDKKYYKGDTVGKTGIEESFEEQLKGVDGYKKVQVDALGRVTKELEVSEPKSGDTVYLSIDKDLQATAEDVLKRTIDAARTGGTFQSPFGNKNFSTPAPNAKSGALIAIDVKTGDVLAMASYPDYDPNKLVNGISYDDYKKYFKRENENDVLSPSAQVNLATQGVFQPGSTFKMVTGMAAIDNGLDPNYAINDTGVIKLGSRPFADYIWHKSRGNHGYTNLYKAIQESCNIYFYTIGSGKNWIGGKDPQVKIGPNDILEYAKKFGLDDYTGLNEEIYEREGKVPSIQAKLESAKALLRRFLDKEMANAFTDITKKKDKGKYEARIEEIIKWAEEDKTVNRVEAMNRLAKLNVKEDKIEYFADKIVFDHLKFAKWSTADTFNLAIGQGENQYTPAQIARYTAAIANGGDLVELSAVDKVISSDYASVTIDENKKEKIEFNDSENLKHLTEGMKRVTTQSSAKSLFVNLPVSVAGKTGTAEKSGKIPTENEYEYLINHMASYGVSTEEAIKLSKKMKLEREKELSKERELEIKEELKNKELKEEEINKLEEELKDGVHVKLENVDRVNVAYLRKAIKELNPKINDEKIDQYKESYGAFAWSVGFAPADDPEIAVVAMIPQGESSSYAMLMVREVMGNYFGLGEDRVKSEESKVKDDSDKFKNKDINFVSQMKK